LKNNLNKKLIKNILKMGKLPKIDDAEKPEIPIIARIKG